MLWCFSYHFQDHNPEPHKEEGCVTLWHISMRLCNEKKKKVLSAGWMEVGVLKYCLHVMGAT